MKRILASLALVAWFAAPLDSHVTAGTLEQIAKTGKVRIGYRKSQPPMSFLDIDGKPVACRFYLPISFYLDGNKIVLLSSKFVYSLELPFTHALQRLVHCTF